MEHRSLALCDIASVNDACGGELVTNQEAGEPVQCVMVVREDPADVFYGRIPVTGTVQDAPAISSPISLRNTKRRATTVPKTISDKLLILFRWALGQPFASARIRALRR